MYRKLNRYSQEYLASHSGITRQHYQRIESGIHKPSVELALKFACILNCKVEDLFQLEEDISYDTYGYYYDK